MVVALLAVLKAGGAYVALDSAYPRERLAFMLEDAEVALLLAETRVRARFPDRAGQVLLLDAESETIAGESEANLSRQRRASNLAYVIYTSGSTGLPKGVAVEHHSTVNFLYWPAKSSLRRILPGFWRRRPSPGTTRSFELFVPLVGVARRS